MTKIISIANQKGGVGKSTLCIQLAFYLSMKKNKKVLVIDMDAQGNTTSRLAPREPSKAGNREFETKLSGTTAAELFADTLDNIELLKCPSGIDLIHSPKNDPLSSDVEALPLDKAMNPRRHLSKLMPNYDYVIIDCPPSLGRKLVGSLAMSTHVACPIKLSGFAVDGVEGLLSTIIGIRESCNERLSIIGVVVNDMDRSVNHDRSLKELEKEIPSFLFDNKIMHRPPLDTATTEGVPIWELRYGHVASREVIAVLDELLEKVG